MRSSVHFHRTQFALCNGYLWVAACSFAFFAILYPYARPFPYSDDWSYIPYLVRERELSLAWIFALHNDHRIPLQKILHVLVLRGGGGDFRFLVALNVAVVAATAIFWVMLSRLVHERPTRSEWIPGMMALAFGFNTVVWGFSFQFLSSLFFLSWACYAWARDARGGRADIGVHSFLILSACAWCGGNGVLTSSVVGLGWIAGLLFFKGARATTWKTWLAVVFWGATNALVWGTWTSSSATAIASKDVTGYVDFALGMSRSWLGVIVGQYGMAATLFSTAVLLFGLVGAAVLVSKRDATGSGRSHALVMLPVLLLGLQSAVLVAAITTSRAGAQPWWPGLELHYGYLVTAAPVGAWMVMLLLPNAAVRQMSLLVLGVVVALGYLSNAAWRMEVAPDAYKRDAVVVADILSSMPADQVARRHIKQLYWVDGPEAQAAVSAGITSLRKSTFWSTVKVD